MLRRFFVCVLTILITMSGFTALPAVADSKMPYYIDVDLTNQITTVYRTSDGSIARQMICSSGINDSTPQGKWRMVEKGRASERSAWTYLAQYKCYVKYATRVHLGYMFHSLPYNSKQDTEPDPEAEAALGTPASHGCIRLRWEDAYFIAVNCQTGTWVNFHKDNEPNEELRTLLKESSYSDEDGMTYNEFLGYSENALARGNSGQEVLDLQHRLADLGYYDGDITGIYDAVTVRAVKSVQADMGYSQTGITSDELKQILFSNDAPVSTGNTTLKLGSSGPVVSKLQDELREIGVFNGTTNGIFDPDTEAAVKLFQGACNTVADGEATPLLQQILNYEIEQITEACGEGFSAEVTTEEIIMATLQADTKIIVRSQPKSDSNDIGRLKNGDVVIVNAANDEWAQISIGSAQGYVKRKYLNGYKQTNTILKFNGTNGTYSIGHTMAEYTEGAQSLAQKYAGGVPKSKSSSAAQAETVTVNTGSDDISMNLRSGPGSENAVIGEVPNGTLLEVLGKEDGWTKVNYNTVEGYLMNDYLTFNGSAFSGDSSVEEEDIINEETTAVVISAGGANVYEQPSGDAVRMKSVNAGTVVQVLEMNDSDFVCVAYNGKKAYMLEKDLQFQLN